MQVLCGCGRGMTCQGGLALVPNGSGDEVHAGMTSQKHGTSSQCAAGGRAGKSPNGKHNSFRIDQANMAADGSNLHHSPPLTSLIVLLNPCYYTRPSLGSMLCSTSISCHATVITQSFGTRPANFPPLTKQSLIRSMRGRLALSETMT